jgi:hypothetical protein
MLSGISSVLATPTIPAVAFPSANNWYVRSGASGSANGAEWTDAYLTVNAALNATNTQPGDTIWVSDDHVESQITTGLILSTNNNTVTTPTYIICANHSSGNIPPNMTTDLATTANITSRDLTLTISNGAMSFYGINFNAASGNAGGFGAITINPANQSMQRFINCTFNQVGNNTPTGPALTVGGTTTNPCEFIFNNCNFIMTQPLHRIVFNGGLASFHNSTFTANSTTFIYQGSGIGSYSRTRFSRCNLANVTATYLYDAGIANAEMYDIAFNQCQWSANIANYVETPVNMSQAPIQMTRTNGAYNSVFLDYWGQSQMSNTIFRVGGAHDTTTGNNYSQSLTTFNNANTSAMFPATANPIVKWNSDTTDTLFATIYGNANVAANTLTNAQLWIEVEYLANTSPNNVTSISSSGCNGNNPTIYPWNVTAASPIVGPNVLGSVTTDVASSTIALTCATPVSVGTPVIVMVYDGHVPALGAGQTVTDSKGNVYTSKAYEVSGFSYCQVFGAIVTTALTATDTITYTSTSGTTIPYILTAYSCPGYKSFDTANGQNGTIGTFSVSSATPAANNELYFGYIVDVNTTVPSSLSGWVKPSLAGYGTNAGIYYKVNQTNTAVTFAGTLGGTQPTAVTLVSLAPVDNNSVWTGGNANGNFTLQTSFKAGQPGIVKCFVKSGIASSNSISVNIDPILYIANSTGGYVSNTALTSNTTLSYNTGLAQINESKSGIQQPAIKNVWTIS